MDKHTIRNDKGEIDINASVNEYSKALSLWVKENEVNQDEISKAMDTILDRFDLLPIQMLVQETVQELNPTPEKFNVLKKQVQGFIKAQREIGVLMVKTGKHGGIHRTQIEDKTSS